MARLLETKDIPLTLWDPSARTMHLPPVLKEVWLSILDSKNLREQAMSRCPEGIAGGVDEKSTNDHLAWRYTGSAARVQLTVLDPTDDFPHIAEMYERLFSGNRAIMVDVPCGSGAAALSVLSTLAELRRQKRVPREPIDVVLISGEISPFARENAQVMLAQAKDALSAQGIFVHDEFHSWDVCEKSSSTQFITTMVRRREGCPTGAIIVANFSDFLHKERKFDEAKGQLEELFRYFSDANNSALWIEPQRNDILKGGFFKRILNWAKTKGFRNFIRRITGAESEENAALATTDCSHPIEGIESFKVHLAVLHFSLERNS